METHDIAGKNAITVANCILLLSIEWCCALPKSLHILFTIKSSEVVVVRRHGESDYYF